MKHIVDIEALKNCLELIPKCKVNGQPYVCLGFVHMMIDSFPKEEYRGAAYNATCDSINEDIRSGKGLKPLT